MHMDGYVTQRGGWLIKVDGGRDMQCTRSAASGSRAAVQGQGWVGVEFPCTAEYIYLCR